MIFARILLYLSLAASFTFLISGYGYQWNIWSLGLGFTLLRYSAYAAIGLSAVSLLSLWFLRKSRKKAILYAVIALFFSGVVAGSALYWQNRAQSVPPIHDITTDFENPPEFSAIVRLRAEAPNPSEYEGEETARMQREAYPQIEPVIFSSDLQEVMDAAVILVVQRGWDLVAINRQEGRIEATEKLPWFGFKDDVVIRITEIDGVTRVDMRSKSRVGRGDLGVNARRINRFLRDLDASIE